MMESLQTIVSITAAAVIKGYNVKTQLIDRSANMTPSTPISNNAIMNERMRPFSPRMY